MSVAVIRFSLKRGRYCSNFLLIDVIQAERCPGRSKKSNSLSGFDLFLGFLHLEDSDSGNKVCFLFRSSINSQEKKMAVYCDDNIKNRSNDGDNGGSSECA